MSDLLDLVPWGLGLAGLVLFLALGLVALLCLLSYLTRFIPPDA